MNVDLYRRRFQALHSALRDEGHNPVEAMSLLAAAVGKDGHIDDGRLAPNLQMSLSGLATDTDSAAVSVAFQQFMTSEARNGLGQYLTPAPVAELIAAVVAMTEPSSVLDPFAGSGLLLDRVGNRLASTRLLGIEINNAVANVTQAVSRLCRHSIDVTEADAFARWVEGLIPAVDAVVTNPPFGSVATRADRRALEQIGVPKELLNLGMIPAELLGLELSVSVLRPGGILAIVLPQSVITNSRWSGYRARLFEKLRLTSVVSLPEETFSPFKGVAKSCVLFGVKEQCVLPSSVPYHRSLSVGYDDTGRLVGTSDLDHIERAILEARLDGPVATVEADGRFTIPPDIQGLDPSDCYRLGDIADVFTGNTPPRGSHAAYGPQQLSVGGLAGGFISWRPRGRSFLPQQYFDRHRKAHLRLKDICLTAAAHKPRYIGLKVDLVDEMPSEGAMASAEVMVIRLKAEAPLSPVDLLFFLRSKAGYRQIQDLVRGSTAHLYPADMKNLLIPPVKNEQINQRASEAYWQAAHHFREHLRLEAEAFRLAGSDEIEVKGEH